MISKCNKIRAAWATGDRAGALRIDGRFFDQSADTLIFKRGMDAHNNPRFYQQLGQEPDQITAAALRRLAEKFKLEGGQPVADEQI